MKFIATKNFDDGTRKDADGKPLEYKRGDAYTGKGDVSALKEAGLLVPENEFSLSKDTLDSKDANIARLEKDIRIMQEEIDVLTSQNKELMIKNAELKEQLGSKAEKPTPVTFAEEPPVDDSDDEIEIDPDQLSGMTVSELRKIAKGVGVTGYARATKAELIDSILSAAESDSEEVPQAVGG